MSKIFSGSLKGLLMLCSVCISFLGCQKDLSGSIETTSGTAPDLTTKVKASVSGFVNDENGHAVQGASVKAGTVTATTNQYGYFEIKNTDVVKTAATVTVTYSGYFKSIKTWMAGEGKSAFFRIKLIRKINAGNFTASSGGSVTTTAGLKATFPANAVVNAATNAAYSGVVNVAAYWIDPTSGEVYDIMPGDLRGIDADNSLKYLKSYGMAAVELTGASGELLQIAPDKKATLNFPIPSTITASAPSSIPLWSFDETTGLWKQEGTAVKNGTEYVGDVSHFSFWNCDFAGPYVQLTVKFIDAAGAGIANADVWVSNIAGGSAHGYTNEEGYIIAPIPANAQLDLKYYLGHCYTTPDYITSFATTNADIDLGAITVAPDPATTAFVSGTVTNCAGLPVAHGAVYMSGTAQGFYARYVVTNGIFSFPAKLCNSSHMYDLIAENAADLQQSNTQTVTLNFGNNAVGNVQACGNTATEYLQYILDGTPHSFSSPAGYAVHINEVGYSVVQSGAQSQNEYVSFDYENTTPAAGSVQALQRMSIRPSADSLVFNTGSQLHITEYGSIGQYVSGNFSVIVHKWNDPAITHTLVCNFRSKRY